MDATVSRSEATTPVKFKVDEFRELAKERGAEKHGDRAELLGIDRSTLDRWNNGSQLPRLEIALTVAKKLGVPVEDLWELNAGTAA